MHFHVFWRLGKIFWGESWQCQLCRWMTRVQVLCSWCCVLMQPMTMKIGVLVGISILQGLTFLDFWSQASEPVGSEQRKHCLSTGCWRLNEVFSKGVYFLLECYYISPCTMRAWRPLVDLASSAPLEVRTESCPWQNQLWAVADDRRAHTRFSFPQSIYQACAYYLVKEYFQGWFVKAWNFTFLNPAEGWNVAAWNSNRWFVPNGLNCHLSLKH